MIKTLPLLLLSLIILSGCVDRATADEKLATGCAAGAEIFLDEGFKIKEITDKKFRDSPSLGRGYREVTLSVIESDGWYDGETTYQCIFVETVGLLNTTHKATIYQLRLSDDEIYGKEGDKLLGTFEDHLKLTETVEQGMNR